MTNTLAPDVQRAFRDRYRRWTTPRPDGLPNRAVVGVPLGILGAVLVAFVALGLTGSSTGVVYDLIRQGQDPALIAGEPEPIRSDEWFVQTSWVISQVEQDLPARNETFPGGMDATVQNDLPTTDWSTALRPHLWGFFFLPLDQAMALKWWLPGFAVIAAGYLLSVVLMPRRPVTAAALTVGFFFAPFFQWWYLSTTLYPAAWAFLVMTTAVWCLRSPRRRGAWILAAVTAWTTAAMAVGVYAPFIVPVVLVAAAFVVGAILMPTDDPVPLRRRLSRLTPLLVAGAVAAVVMVVWLITRWSTIQGFTSTVYPGERLQKMGEGGWSELAQLFGGFLSFDLGRTAGKPFAMNMSEASTFFLPGLFLVVVMGWLAVDRWRTARRADPVSIALVVAGAVMLAFLLVPGWDAIAHLLLLDRTTSPRMRIGFGVLSFVMVLVVGAALDDRRRRGAGRGPWWVSLCALAVAVASIAMVLWRVHRTGGLTVYLSGIGPAEVGVGVVLAVLFLFSVVAFARGGVTAGAIALLVVSIVSSLGVNPLYRGVLDLRETSTVQAVQQRDEQDPGTWVGITSSSLPTMMLVEAGVTALNGFQGAPSAEMWAQIDPTGAAEEEWNRLGMVSWVLGSGDPAPRNPYPDQVQMTFDACAPFAQDHVTWVLSEVPIESACVALSETVQEGPTTMRIYEVQK
ncbi:hypothetical protein FHS07_000441 [Microbacterium proteolyticum]|uniref:4-amino-4-deoxy-L-arabinose transferase n=1 Tax=Microbacterium proteolyticum TaxID=1572644 RepID=A0A7W5CFL9_9MICO|nr:hypothetical protein [Microbacterium proteolyticum]MBB3156757.1 hypothetical protein [Microbacterium proteolyticum]